MPPTTRRRRNNSISRSPYQHGGSNRRQSTAQMTQHSQSGGGGLGLGGGLQFQNYFANQQRSMKPFSHPIYNLPISQPTPHESQFLNDEVDLYLIRGNILRKFEIENGLLDNILLKNISCNEIKPPLSFPDCIIDGDLFDHDKFIEFKKQDNGGVKEFETEKDKARVEDEVKVKDKVDTKVEVEGEVKDKIEVEVEGDNKIEENEEEKEKEKENGNEEAKVIEKNKFNDDKIILNNIIKENKIDDYLFGNLKLMKLKEKFMEEELKKLENDKLTEEIQEENKKIELEDLVNKQYSFEYNKIKELGDVFSNYSPLKIKDYENKVDEIQKEFQIRFSKKIIDEYQIKQTSIKSFDSFKKSISYKDYKELQLKTIEKIQLEQKKRQEEQERLQRLNDGKIREAQEEAKKLQIYHQQPSMPSISTASAQVPSNTIAVPNQVTGGQGNSSHPGMQPSIPGTRMEHSASGPGPIPAAIPAAVPVPAPAPAPVTSSNHPIPNQNNGDSGYQDPFGGDQGSNFDFDNLYGAGDELIMGDDENGDFGALEDQVFLSNLDGSMD